MCDLQVEIPADEKVVRAIKKLHLKPSGQVRPNALRPKGGQSAVSVMRQVMGNDFCKNKAGEIAGADYQGLLSIRAAVVREKGSDVFDWRQDFCGHAHIDHGILVPLPDGEPLAPEVNHMLTERCKEIISCGVYHSDPVPHAQGWSGGEL